jgi:hypothetical protein
MCIHTIKFIFIANRNGHAQKVLQKGYICYLFTSLGLIAGANPESS